jgi:predicted nucleotidyltransferase
VKQIQRFKFVSAHPPFEDSDLVGFINKHLDDIRQICSKYRVKRLELFGSAASESHFDPRKSDLDFLVEFLPLKTGEYADSYFGLLEAMERLFQRHVDLVMPKAVTNPYFIESINRNREVLYAA